MQEQGKILVKDYNPRCHASLLSPNLFKLKMQGNQKKKNGAFLVHSR